MLSRILVTFKTCAKKGGIIKVCQRYGQSSIFRNSTLFNDQLRRRSAICSSRVLGQGRLCIVNDHPVASPVDSACTWALTTGSCPDAFAGTPLLSSSCSSPD